MKDLCWLLLFVFLTSGGSVFGAGHVCDDWDSQACVLLASSHPDICNSTLYSMDSCRRFCGNCPIECYDCPTPVKNLADCSAIVSCKQGQQCVIQHLLAADGHHEYKMGCDENNLCSTFASGFGGSLIGKRDVIMGDMTSDDVDINHKRNGRSSISYSCCDTDLCNFPLTTTTQAPIPTLVAHVGNASCDDLDLVFVVDDSGSVGQNNYQLALDFVKSVIEHLNIGPLQAQTAFVGFSTQPHVYWHLLDYGTRDATVQGLSLVRYMSGTTHTAEALKLVRTNVLTAANGDRHNARNVVIVMTDGRSNNPAQTAVEANLLHGQGQGQANVVAIGIGQGVSASELNAIATNPHNVLGVNDYSALSQIVSQTVGLVCL